MRKFSNLFSALGFGVKKRRGIRPNKRRTLTCEPLEQRQLLSLCVWSGQGQDNKWSTGAELAEQRCPGGRR